MIRGFATNRLLYTVDGVRMNTAIFRAGNLQNVISLDPFAIEKTAKTIILNDAGASEVNVQALNIGAQSIDFFAGVDEGQASEVGLDIQNSDFALAIMTENGGAGRE